MCATSEVRDTGPGRSMPSIAERIAALNASSKGTAAAPAPAVDQSPKGTILYSGVLGKYGSGILASTVAKRHVVVHSVDDIAWLSIYEDAAHTIMKGSRLKLKEATISTADANIQVVAQDEKSSVAKETITKSYTNVCVTAKFRAASTEEAEEWARQLKGASQFPHLAPAPPSGPLPGTASNAATEDQPSSQGKMRRGSSQFAAVPSEDERPGLGGRTASLQATFDETDRAKERPRACRACVCV